MRVTVSLGWALAAAVVLGYPATTFAWAKALYDAGELPVDGDSIGLPIGLSLMVTVLAGPVVLGLS